MAFHELVVCFYFFNLEDLKWVGKRIDQDQVKEMKSTVAIEWLALPLTDDIPPYL